MWTKTTKKWKNLNQEGGVITVSTYENIWEKVRKLYEITFSWFGSHPAYAVRDYAPDSIVQFVLKSILDVSCGAGRGVMLIERKPPSSTENLKYFRNWNPFVNKSFSFLSFFFYPLPSSNLEVSHLVVSFRRAPEGGRGEDEVENIEMF